MMDWVLKRGEIKDGYEPLALLSDLYVQKGLAPSVHKAREMLDPKLDPKHSERDFQAEAKAVFDDLRQHDLFGAMSREYQAAAEAGGSSTRWNGGSAAAAQPVR